MDPLGTSNVPFDGDFGFGLALSGSIFTALVFVYLAHSTDVLIRKHTFKTMSNAVPIFCGVLIHSFSRRLLSAAQARWSGWSSPFLDVLGVPETVIALILHAVLWFVVLRVVARIQAWRARWRLGDNGPWCCLFDTVVSGSEAQMEKERLRVMKQHMLDSRILAYVNGFAAVGAWISLEETFSPSVFRGVLFVVAAMVVYAGLVFCDELSWRIWSDLTGRRVDDEAEGLRRHAVAEAENDAVALIGSSLFVRSVALHYATIEQLEDFTATRSEARHLCEFAAVAFFIFGLYHYNVPNCGHGHGFSQHMLHRLSEVVTLFLAMISCWSVYWALHACVECFVHNEASEMSALRRLATFRAAIVGIFATFGVFLYVWVCIKIVESPCTGERRRRRIEERLAFSAILVGFSWEKAFEKAIVGTCHQSLHPLLTEFVMSFFCIMVLIPGWKRFVVPMDEEHGYNFGFVPRLVVRKAAAMFDAGAPRSAEYREAYREMVMELLRALPKEDTQDVEEYLHAVPENKEALEAKLLSSRTGTPALDV